MSEENTPGDADGALPSNFWSAPDQFITDTSLQLLHAEVVARLRDESPDADTLELMCMERVASLYFYMRDREANGSFSGTAASSYKSIMQLWVGMAADLRKARTTNADESVIRGEITRDLVTAVRDSLQGLEPEVQMTVRQRVVQALGA